MHDFALPPLRTLFVTGFGTQAVGPTSLTLFSYLHFFTYAHRSNPQPHQLEAFRLADRMNLSINGMLIVSILIATVGWIYRRLLGLPAYCLSIPREYVARLAHPLTVYKTG